MIRGIINLVGISSSIVFYGYWLLPNRVSITLLALSVSLLFDSVCQDRCMCDDSMEGPTCRMVEPPYRMLDAFVNLVFIRFDLLFFPN